MEELKKKRIQVLKKRLEFQKIDPKKLRIIFSKKRRVIPFIFILGFLAVSYEGVLASKSDRIHRALINPYPLYTPLPKASESAKPRFTPQATPQRLNLKKGQKPVFTPISNSLELRKDNEDKESVKDTEKPHNEVSEIQENVSKITNIRF